MARLIVLVSLVAGLFFTPFANAESSGSGGGGGSGDKEIAGQIQSVTSTNFSVGTHVGRHHRRLKPVFVHFNPDAVNITIDGVAANNIDVKVTGKYVSVVGKVVNNVLEATSIAITSEAPSHPKPIKSKSTT
jgi:hypothetical protein